MKNLFGSMVIAFSMYSRIPVPHMEWSQEKMKYALCFFPLVGAVVGICFAGSLSLLKWLGFPAFAMAAAVVMPVLVTGGIHMDGFLDVMDAKASHGEREKKLEIMKDPHTGAFAIIYGIVYFCLFWGAVGELRDALIPASAGIFVLSRAFSGLSVVTFPMAKKNGLAAAFSGQARKKVVCGVMICYMAVSAVFFYLTAGLVTAVVLSLTAAAVYVFYKRMSVREFGGTTGDLAGYFLQLAELCLVAALAVISHMG